MNFDSVHTDILSMVDRTRSPSSRASDMYEEAESNPVVTRASNLKDVGDAAGQIKSGYEAFKTAKLTGTVTITEPAKLFNRTIFDPGPYLGTAIFAAAPVLAAWAAAGTVAWSARKSFKLWDLVPKSKNGGGELICTCFKCDDIAYDLANRNDKQVAKTAIAPFVAAAVATATAVFPPLGIAAGGIAAGALLAHSLTPSEQKEKLEIAVNLRLGAMPVHALAEPPATEPRQIDGGCKKAQALIAILFGEFGNEGKQCVKTVAAILSADGEKAIMEVIPG